MKLRCGGGYIWLVLVLATGSTNGQVEEHPTPIDSLQGRDDALVDCATPKAPMMDLSMGKSLGADRWGGEIQWSQSGLGGFHHTSSLLMHRNPSGRRQWKIEQQSALQYERPLARRLGWFLTGEAYLFQDRLPAAEPEAAPPSPQLPSLLSPFSEPQTNRASLSPGRVRIQRTYLGLGCRYSSAGGITSGNEAALTLGPSSEQREGATSDGFRLDGQLTRRFSFGELAASSQFDRLEDVTYHQSWATLAGASNFAGEGADNFRIRYFSARQREFAGSAPTRPGLRIDEQITLFNQLTSDPSAPLAFNWDSEYRQRHTAHRTSSRNENILDRESVWENGFQLHGRTGGLVGTLSGGIDLQELQYAASFSQGRRSRLGLSSAFRLPAVDSVFANLAAIGYRYDTPATDLNDRDELRWTFTLATRTPLTPALSMNWEAAADMNHLVYLFRPRTNENRWTRLFRLAGTLPWHDDPVDNRASLEVAARYSDYDYPPAETDLSRVYRSFTFTDTLILNLSPHWRLESNWGWLRDDNGRLNWREWVENVAQEGYGYSTTVMPTWRSKPDAPLFIGAGWTWSSRVIRTVSSTGGSPSRNGDITQSIRASGPSVALKTPVENRLQARLNGTWLTVNDNTRGRYHIPEVQFKLLWQS